MIETGDIAGCILAGGQSRRMGEDKARLDLGGTPLFAQVLARLAPQVGRVVVNRHDAASPLDIKGLPLVTDAPGDHRGPLAGILAALGWARANGIGWIATVAVDTPFFPRDLVRRLIAAVDGKEIAVAGSGGRLHPVFGLWKTTLAPALADHLAGNRRSVHDWVLARGAGVAEWPSRPYDPFFNINAPADVTAALEIQTEFRP
ncbi:MAG: molybdenum cofactor guanylyltransferase MobA [Pseudomonadota bacterium]